MGVGGMGTFEKMWLLEADTVTFYASRLCLHL